MSRFPLSVHSSGRYLISPDGTPFFILGDSGWEAVHNLNSTDQNSYLDDRIKKGFNAELFEAIEHKFTQSKPPKDLAGNLPFTKRLDGGTYTGSPNGCTGTCGAGSWPYGSGTGNSYSADPYSNINNEAPDFTYPNSTYWSTIDSWISACESRGILCVMFPGYCGFAGDDEGWMGELVANDAVTGAGGQTGQPFANGSKSKLWNYGAWMADRYKSQPNILWVMGGDYGSGGTSGTFTAPQKTAVTNLMAGLRSVAGQQSVLFTAHWSDPSITTDVSLTGQTFDVYHAYGTPPTQYCRNAFSASPTAPAFEIETRYENNPSAVQPIRQYSWFAALQCRGYFYGNEQLWPTTPGWASLINSTTQQNLIRANAFITGLPYKGMLPSGLGGIGTIVTAGGDQGSPGNLDYIASMADPLGNCIVAYVPDANGTSAFSINMALMGGPSLARWFDPSSGAFTNIDVFAASGSHSFTPPGANSSGYNDWLLIITRNLDMTLPGSTGLLL